MFSGRAGQHILLVGQAPGPVEQDQSRPFAGRAGRQLMRWLVRGGFRDEDDGRDRIYMTAMTTCFPGRRPDGAGDRRPSAAEVELCAPWLDGVLALVRPQLIIPIGSLALERFLPGQRLDDVIGAAYTAIGGPDFRERPRRRSTGAASASVGTEPVAQRSRACCVAGPGDRDPGRDDRLGGPGSVSRWARIDFREVLPMLSSVLALAVTGERLRQRDIRRRGSAPLIRGEATSPAEPAVKNAEDILERIFAPTPKASPAEQAERALRRPKQLIYCALSNRNFYWRQHITKFVLDEGQVPIVPFMLFDYYLVHTVPKDVVREAFNNLIVRCDQMWVFGNPSLGVKVQIGIAKRLKKPIRYYDITDMPYRVVSVPEAMLREE